ncbi:hypothetical protein BP00DRAFT_94069 [Aspergillus indologenus CBS 114.80]|uniref:Uncharacterized protein n=1 Tax=Aspergillus indologenus CBS 114.80 TaxID=1450541 RepID=A0A2V5HM99_9EURO|nr:hypothetical protein BP00DRAFT_94069 [Aspergillus indologenus CBS 114.80]
MFCPPVCCLPACLPFPSLILLEFYTSFHPPPPLVTTNILPLKTNQSFVCQTDLILSLESYSNLRSLLTGLSPPHPSLLLSTPARPPASQLNTTAAPLPFIPFTVLPALTRRYSPSSPSLVLDPPVAGSWCSA